MYIFVYFLLHVYKNTCSNNKLIECLVQIKINTTNYTN